MFGKMGMSRNFCAPPGFGQCIEKATFFHRWLAWPESLTHTMDVTWRLHKEYRFGHGFLLWLLKDHHLCFHVFSFDWIFSGPIDRRHTWQIAWSQNSHKINKFNITYPLCTAKVEVVSAWRSLTWKVSRVHFPGRPISAWQNFKPN
jgi:hypothetical protein